MAETTAQLARAKQRKLMTRIAMAGAPLIALGWFGWSVLTGGRYQETDNAYVQASRVAISSSVNGRIVEMRVAENTPVKAGEVLFTLDKAVFQADAAQGESALEAARARVRGLLEEYRGKLVGVSASQERLAYAERELARMTQLGAEGIASRQQVESAEHAVQQAKADLSTARQAASAALANLGGDPSVTIDDHPAVTEAAARLDRSRLALSYTDVIAPQSGTVTKVEQVQVGSFVNAGQTLFWLVSGEPWVEANFKEGQIAKMKEGQVATVRIDALGDRQLKANVTSFSPGTGAVFAALPAQNATGNWVKVVQRVPVRLQFVDLPEGVRLTAGLSAHVRVDTKSPVAADR
jgi:membrane fusion protein (multidrug efflux system)